LQRRTEQAERAFTEAKAALEKLQQEKASLPARLEAAVETIRMMQDHACVQVSIKKEVSV
jgi:hypothetical protein